MAAYIDLVAVVKDSSFQDKVESAVAIAAYIVVNESVATPNHDKRLLWAKEAFSNPRAMGLNMIWSIVAANNTISVAAILEASDVAIQSNINAVVDVFAV